MNSDIGPTQATGQPVVNPLPVSWTNLPTAPATLPDWANFGRLTARQIQNLLFQIGYSLSQWDSQLIGINNALGRYQIQPMTLEYYGLLLSGSVETYGNTSVYYRRCWTPAYIRSDTNSYANYLYNSQSLWDFLDNTPAQDHLAYQILYDSYVTLSRINGITDSDTADTVAGMLSVAWQLGSDGASAWRQTGQGAGADQAFNAGRYVIAVLSS
jgi:hypothetical protein